MAGVWRDKSESARPLMTDEHDHSSRRESFVLDDQVENRGFLTRSTVSGLQFARLKWNTAASSVRANALPFYISRALVWLLPSFIGERLLSAKPSSIATKTRPTAFLDGMRGVAAWFVFNTHLVSVLARNTGAAWGYDGQNHEFFRLPIVRLIFSGHGAVRLFFVISGFALSLSPVAKMNKPAPDDSSAMRSLCSSVFRRPLRLFLPAFASTIPIFFLVRWDFFRGVRAMITDDTIVPGWEYLDRYPLPNPSLWDQVVEWYGYQMKLVQIFKDPGGLSYRNEYNEVLWTIALEWRASLMLFLCHAALYYLARPLRIICILLLILAAIATRSYEMPLFLAGFLLAEFWSKPPPAVPLPNGATGESVPRRRTQFVKKAFFWILLIVGAYIASIPAWETNKVPGFAGLLPYAPRGYNPVDFWASLGAVLLVASVAVLPPMNAFFSSAVIRYLGKISFSFYLVHLALVRAISRLIFYWVWGATGKDAYVVALFGFVVGYALSLAIVVWTADIFWRLVEQPTVDLAKWLEAKCFRA